MKGMRKTTHNIKMADYLARGKPGNTLGSRIGCFTKNANTILNLPVCLVCYIVALVADERRGHTHTHDNYCNQCCGCATKGQLHLILLNHLGNNIGLVLSSLYMSLCANKPSLSCPVVCHPYIPHSFFLTLSVHD